MKRRRRQHRTNRKVTHIVVALLLVFALVGTVVSTGIGAGVTEETAQNESAVYLAETEDSVSGEDGAPDSGSDETEEADRDTSVSASEQEEDSPASGSDESDSSFEEDREVLMEEELPDETTEELSAETEVTTDITVEEETEEVTKEETEEEEDEDIALLAAGDTGAFAVYSADDKSLTFYYDVIPETGTEYNGKTATAVYEGIDTLVVSGQGAAPWNSYRSSITTITFDASFQNVKPVSAGYWFYQCTACTQIIGLQYLDTSNVTSMDDMFSHCSKLTELDVSGFDTHNVISFERMFYECKKVTELDVSGFDTSNATAINGMFRDLQSVKELDLRGFDTSHVTAINAMFRESYALETIYVTDDWDVSGVTNDANMFSNCTSLVGGNGTAYDSGKVVSTMAKVDRDGTEGYFTDVRVLHTVDISGEKVWEDADNQDGIRPESITVNLLADGVPVTEENGDPLSATVTAEDDWTFAFGGLPEYDANFNEILYTVTEDPVEGYEYEVTGDKEDGLVVTNSHTPEQVDVSGTITWEDGSNQDGIRPSAVTVQIFGQDSAGGTYNSQTITVDEALASVDANNWTWEITGLDKYRNGEELTYSVIYTGVDTEVYEQTNDGYNVTYHYDPETTDISGSKTWVDGDDIEGLRPESITIRLHANGSQVVDTREVTAEDGWAWEFTDLPVYENGQEITYKITEDAVDNYDTEYDGFNVINTLAPGETSVTVLKDWEDSHNQDGKRPESITVTLLNGNETATDHDGNEAVMTLSEENDWEGTFKMDEYDSTEGKITYTLKEVSTGVEGYDTEISGDMTEGFVITNSYEPETMDITGTKFWEDADNQDGIRPDSVTVRLLADGTAVNAAAVSVDDTTGEWNFRFADMDKYAGGKEIEYTVEEIVPEGYTAAITGVAEDGFIVTNTHEPELIEAITGTKVWEDDDNRDGLRPEEITVHLLADGEEVDTIALRAAGNWLESVLALFSDTIVTPDADGNWNFTFENLPKYAGGEEIEYTLTEDGVNGYTTEVTGNAKDGFTVTNTHEIETVTVSGAKTWDDADNQDGLRPEEITIRLLADGKEIGESGIDAAADWSWEFTELPRYRDGGTEIEYTITEDAIDAYETTYGEPVASEDGTVINVTNSYIPELYNGDGTFQVVLVWDDEANNDGIRPAEVNVTLTNDNTKVDEATLTLTADNTDADGNWVGTFTGLPKYENGNEITWSVKEELRSGYTYQIELLEGADGKTYVQLTNVHVSVKEEVEITKIWDDVDNQDGIRPDSITIGLVGNGNLYKEVTLKADTAGVTVSDDGDAWSYTMQDIPVDANGAPIEYTLQEGNISNYANVSIETERGEEITDNGVTYQPYAFTITNSHTPEQVEIAGTKVWEDANDQDGIRPQYVTLHLYADGEPAGDIDVTEAEHEDDDANVWDFTFGSFDKYAGGDEIEYTITEDTVESYDTAFSGTAAAGYTVTNTHTPATTQVTGTKTWVDDEDAQNFRPESITIRLHANGAVVDSAEVTAEDNWTWEFTDLPMYENGHAIHYTITEDAVDNYVASYDYGDADNDDADNGDGEETVQVRNVTDTLHEGETSVTVEKDWEDEENQDGIRPESITVELWADGVKTEDSLVLSEENHWEGVFEEMAANAAGTKIVYTIEEVTVTDQNGGSGSYEAQITGNASEGFVITNSHEPAKTEVSATKIWEDADNQDGIRPGTVTIHLLADGEPVESLHLTEAEDWEWTFSDLDAYADGEEIEYTIEVVYVADGYIVSITGDAEQGFVITSTHDPEQVDIAGEKLWEDADNQDGIRPETITVSLLADGDPVLNEENEPVTVSLPAADGSWTYDFGEYDKYAEGKEIDYTVSEGSVDGYKAAYDGYTIINTHTPEKFNGDGTLGVILRWDDEEDQDGIRPHSNTVTLTVGGEETGVTLVLSDANQDENGNWIGTFTSLDKYADGEEIKYGVSEGVMPGYTYTAELVYEEDQEIYYIEITNTHAAVTEDITVTKVWDDNDDQDSMRPDSITLNLFSNGSAVKSTSVSAETEGVEVSADGNTWTYTFRDLPVDQNGQPIVYSMTEVEIEDYTSAVTADEADNVTDNGVTYTPYAFTVTNTHEPVQTEVSVTKVWEDNDDQDGLRPHSITLELLIDEEPALDEDGEPITGTMIPDQDGHWNYTFTGIDKFAEGKLIRYSVEEFDVEGYEEISVTGTMAAGYVITNLHVPGKTALTGNKVWNDYDDMEELRPEQIILNLYANGILKDSIAVGEEDGWTWTFDDLDVNSGGQKITYITTEEAIENYDTTYDGFDLINTIAPGETSVTVAKDWEDADDQDGIRPDSVTVTLVADGVKTEDTLVLSEENNWEGVFHEQAKYDDGTKIEYTVEEDPAAGYESAITGNASEGFILTNTHEPETIEVSGEITWDDGGDQDGIRPETVTVTLLADGEPIYTQDVTFEEDDWSYTFSDLPRYKDGGTKIVYTIAAAPVDGYTTTVDGYHITNTHETEKTEVSVTKVWEDNEDQDGLRPYSIELILLTDENGTPAKDADGQAITGTMVPDQEGHWTYTFTGVDKNAGGEAIEYSVDESAVEGYEKISVTGNQTKGFVITNRHEPETTEISGSKVWKDNDDAEELRPDRIVINLYADGVLKDSKTVTEEDGWAWTFENLDAYSGGQKITYLFTEEAIDDYDSSYDGYDVNNTLDAGMTSVTVIKDWEDNDNQDGIRPESITVALYADGVETEDTLVLSEENQWVGAFHEQAKYDNGTRIEYTIEETETEGYESTLTGDALDGFILTNTHETENIDISGSVIWDDRSDQDGIRPENVMVYLLADGEPVLSQDVLSADGSFAFTDLPRYRDGGEEIQYSIAGAPADGYTTSADGVTLTYIHEPEQTDVPITKNWEDNDDQDGKRPDSLTFTLLKEDGTAAAGTVLTAADNWTGTIAADKYENGGEEIFYTLKEEMEEIGDEYTSELTGSPSDGYTVTNTHEPERITDEDGDLLVSILWNDADNAYGTRPESLTITLTANGEPVYNEDGSVAALTLSDENDWSGVFTGLSLYRYAGGVEIAYSVEEGDLSDSGYSYTVRLVYDEETGIWHMEVVNRYETAEEEIGTEDDTQGEDNPGDGDENGGKSAQTDDNGGTGDKDKNSGGTDGSYGSGGTGGSGIDGNGGSGTGGSGTGSSGTGSSGTGGNGAVSSTGDTGGQAPTGDNSNMLLWILLLAAALIAVTGVGVSRRRSRFRK